MDKLPEDIAGQLDEVLELVSELLKKLNSTNTSVEIKGLEDKLEIKIRRLRKEFGLGNSGTFKVVEQASSTVPNISNYTHETK